MLGIIVPLITLVGSALMSAICTSMRTLGPIHSKRISCGKSFFFYSILKCLRRFEWKDTFFFFSASKAVLLVIYAETASVLAFNHFEVAFSDAPISTIAIIGAIEVSIVLITSVIMKAIAKLLPKATTKALFLPASLFPLVLFPILLPFYYLIKAFLPSEEPQSPKAAKDKIMELAHDADLSRYLDPTQSKLLTSLATFQERIAREIMVPRIDVTALDQNITVREATKAFQEEQYSRVPVYSGTVDQICGVLLYKDVLELYINNSENGADFLDAPIKPLVKPILYAPETKKISKLLQEFRKAQNHLAIIVDEYGGTEGIVSIEDILEELVGEIEDEFDTDDETLYKRQENGQVIVDAKMGVNDIAKELGVQLPQSPEYDTIGGYIFHRAGSIPAKGWRIHHETFDLEVLSSTPRAIQKIRIIPLRVSS